MKNDSKAPIVARVDLTNVKYKKPKFMGIDYANEIDFWSKLEFKLRNRVSKPTVMTDLNSYYYSIRESLD